MVAAVGPLVRDTEALKIVCSGDRFDARHDGAGAERRIFKKSAGRL